MNSRNWRKILIFFGLRCRATGYPTRQQTIVCGILHSQQIASEHLFCFFDQNTRFLSRPEEECKRQHLYHVLCARKSTIDTPKVTFKSKLDAFVRTSRHFVAPFNYRKCVIKQRFSINLPNRYAFLYLLFRGFRSVRRFVAFN
jgi:hypothetical protein